MSGVWKNGAVRQKRKCKMKWRDDVEEWSNSYYYYYDLHALVMNTTHRMEWRQIVKPALNTDRH